MFLTIKSLRNRRGVAMIEYALLAALVGLFLVVSVTGMRDNLADVFEDVGTALGGAGEGEE